MLAFTLFFLLSELGIKLVITTNVIKRDINIDKKRCISNLKNEIKLIKIDCGEICQTSSCKEKVHSKGK
jgi:hypothetical protein